MDGLLLKSVVKVNDKVVLERVDHLRDDANAVGQDRAKLRSEFTGKLSKDLKSNGSAALQTKSKRPEISQLQPAGPKTLHIKQVDIVGNLDAIAAQLKKLRSLKFTCISGKFDVEAFSEKLGSDVAKLKVLAESLSQDVSAGKVCIYILTKNRVIKKHNYKNCVSICIF